MDGSATRQPPRLVLHRFRLRPHAHTNPPQPTPPEMGFDFNSGCQRGLHGNHTDFNRNRWTMGAMVITCNHGTFPGIQHNHLWTVLTYTILGFPVRNSDGHFKRLDSVERKSADGGPVVHFSASRNHFGVCQNWITCCFGWFGDLLLCISRYGSGMVRFFRNFLQFEAVQTQTHYHERTSKARIISQW